MSHNKPFTSPEDMKAYILARASTKVGKEAIDDRALASALYTAAGGK